MNNLGLLSLHGLLSNKPSELISDTQSGANTTWSSDTLGKVSQENHQIHRDLEGGDSFTLGGRLNIEPNGQISLHDSTALIGGRLVSSAGNPVTLEKGFCACLKEPSRLTDINPKSDLIPRRMALYENVQNVSHKNITSEIPCDTSIYNIHIQGATERHVREDGTVSLNNVGDNSIVFSIVDDSKDLLSDLSYTCESGYWNNTGSVSNPGIDIHHQVVTEYIPVTPGKEYLLYNVVHATLYYDINKYPVDYNVGSFLFKTKDFIRDVHHTYGVLVTIPTDVHFIRISKAVGTAVGDVHIYEEPKLRHKVIHHSLVDLKHNTTGESYGRNYVGFDAELGRYYVDKVCDSTVVFSDSIQSGIVLDSSLPNCHRASIPLWLDLGISDYLAEGAYQVCSWDMEFIPDWELDEKHFFVHTNDNENFSRLAITIPKSELSEMTEDALRQLLTNNPLRINFKRKEPVRVYIDDLDLPILPGRNKVFIDCGYTGGTCDNLSLGIKKLIYSDKSTPSTLVPVVKNDGDLVDIRYYGDDTLEWERVDWNSHYGVYSKEWAKLPSGYIKYLNELQGDKLISTEYNLVGEKVRISEFVFIKDSHGKIVPKLESERRI